MNEKTFVRFLHNVFFLHVFVIIKSLKPGSFFDKDFDMNNFFFYFSTPILHPLITSLTEEE